MEALILDERIVDYKFKREDFEEAGLRPRCFDEYIGQEKVKENLMVFYRGCEAEKRAA
jgi:Holliday junction DNA helicase RuvB